MIKKLLILLSLLPALALAQTYPSPTYNNLTLIHPLPIASGGTGASTATAALTNLGADALGSATNRDIYVSTVGNDTNNGTSWGFAKLTLQAALNAAASSTGGVVHVGAGTWTLPGELFMQPHVRMLCEDNATITQANGANLGVMIDFTVNTATGASIENCKIDGNRANNTDNVGDIMLYVATTSDVNLVGNTIQNGNGVGVDVLTGLRPTIALNKFFNFYVGPIYLQTGVGSTATSGQIVNNYISGNIGQHAITLATSDYNNVSGNTINASLQTGMVVSASGTAVTLTSGPNFSTLSPGSFLILNGGTEALITAINSNSSLTVLNSLGTLTNVPAAAGPGDLVSILSASHNNIENNIILKGVGGGIVISNDIAGESTYKNTVVGNHVSGSGEGCISVQGEGNFSTVVSDTLIVGNNINDCGVGGTAIAPTTQYGIALLDFGTATMVNTFVDGNLVRDDQGSPTTQNWMGLAGLAAGTVFVGKNTGIGMVSPGIANGISSIVLSAGWGTTASTSAIVSYGDGFIFTVTSSGTGQTANPNVTVNTRATTSDNPPLMICKQTAGTGTLTGVVGEQAGVDSSPALQAFSVVGTPVAGNTYIFQCRG